MSEQQSGDPLHGITLKQILDYLVDCYGWNKLAVWTKIRYFGCSPSLSSALKFLRKTPWARSKIENLYIATRNSKLKRGEEL